ncbi:hypothetical protein DL98DRAFT_586018 [Cadophora sp. DSE1049]|nr:hypothetical protein DL98DRAFT_586018 [Cadophora sp. DSE1049]
MSRRYTAVGRANLKRLGFASDTSSDSEVEAESSSKAASTGRPSTVLDEIQAVRGQRRPTPRTANSPNSHESRALASFGAGPAHDASIPQEHRPRNSPRAAAVPRAVRPPPGFRHRGPAFVHARPSANQRIAQTQQMDMSGPAHDAPQNNQASPRKADGFAMYQDNGSRGGLMAEARADMGYNAGGSGFHNNNIEDPGYFEQASAANTGRSAYPLPRESPGGASADAFMASGFDVRLTPNTQGQSPLGMAASQHINPRSRFHGPDHSMHGPMANTGRKAAHGESTSPISADGLMSNSSHAHHPPSRQRPPRITTGVNANHTLGASGQEGYMQTSPTGTRLSTGLGGSPIQVDPFRFPLSGLGTASPHATMQRRNPNMKSIIPHDGSRGHANGSANGFMPTPQSTASNHISAKISPASRATFATDLDVGPPTKKARIGSKGDMSLASQAAVAQGYGVQRPTAYQNQRSSTLSYNTNTDPTLSLSRSWNFDGTIDHLSAAGRMSHKVAEETKKLMKRDLGGEIMSAMDRLRAVNDEHQKDELEEERLARAVRKTRGRRNEKTRQDEDGA